MGNVRFLKVFLIIAVASLSLLALPSLMPSSSRVNPRPLMVSYNPAPANNLHAPLSSMSLIGLANATPAIRISASSTANSQSSGRTGQSIRQNALRFIIDNSYFSQSETTIAVDPNNPNHVVGGFNDASYFFCPVLPSDCSFSPASLSGFTTSTDGGISVAKGNNIPDLNIAGSFLASWGDPSVAATIDGNFFYASLALNPGSPIFGNGIMIAKSNANLFNSTASCNTLSTAIFNPCWNAVLVFGKTTPLVFSVEDKDRIAVDRDSSSPYYGSVYLGWDHFDLFTGQSTSYLARCDSNLVSCTMLSGGTQPLISGNDQFVAWTTPVVDNSGYVHVAWCNFGTFTTFGPVTCRMTTSSPGGASFGPTTDIVSYMGAGTTLPKDTVVIGWATEQFRIGAGLISVAADLTAGSNNLYFTTQVCTAGHYYAVSPLFAPVAADNPGNCGQSAVLFSRSTDGGSTWSSPTTLSKPAVNDQPYVTVDSQTGTVYVVYYTTQYDSFNHRIDVVASISNNHGQNFHQSRVSSVSNEPDSDPSMYNYIVGNGIGGSFSVPQYGDYFEATAMGGSLWVLFTGNYAVEAGTFQTDPFLAVLNSQSMQ